MNSNARPPLVIVNGPAGAGKSTLATVIAKRLGLPLLEKDTIKEAMADVVGARDQAASYQLGLASFAVMGALAKKYLDLGIGAVLEAPFYGQAAEELRPLAAVAWAVIVQCQAEKSVLYDRVCRRATARHWVHFDNPTRPLDETVVTWSSPDLAAAEPPPIGAPILTVHTDQEYDPPVEQLLLSIQAYVTGAN